MQSKRKGPLNRAKNRAISLIAILIFLFAGSARGAEEKPNASPEGQPPQSREVEGIAAVPSHIMASVKKVNQGKRQSRSSGVEAREGGVIKVEPGRNVHLTVAGDQLNRIVTPFANPVVHTVGKAKIKVDGSVLYVSLAQEEGPTTMFVTENGEADTSLSLTLAPQAVAPREIRLELAGGGPMVSLGGKSAKWEKDVPYTQAIEKVMLGTARGEVPPGYNLRDSIDLDPRPRCRLPVRVEPRQVLEGHNFLVVVSRLTNVSSAPMLLDESACYQEGVRAVAVWPQVNLSPGQSTELYVVFGRDFGHKRGKRPSVLREGIHKPPEPPKRKQPPRPDSVAEPEPAAVSEVLHTPWPMSANLP